MPSIETPDPVHAVKSHHEARFDLIVPPPPPHLLQAPRCTVVTSSRRLPTKVKAWLQNSDAEHWAITNSTMKRLRSGRKNCRLECGSVLNNLVSADGFSWMKNWLIRRSRLSGSRW